MLKTKKRQAVTWETPPPQRGQHDALEVVSHDPKNAGAKRVQLRYPDRLSKYLALKSITGPMFEAGKALAADWEKAGCIPRQTINLLAAGGGSHTMTERHVEARQRLAKALAGDRKRYSDLLISVCCFDSALNDTRRLRRGLLLLAYHYGLIRRGYGNNLLTQ